VEEGRTVEVAGQFEDALVKLEFDRVRQRVIRYAASELGIELLRSLQIMTSVAGIRGELAAVSEMKRLLEEDEDLPLAGIHPVAVPIQKAAVEGTVLLSKELVQISSTLRAARIVRGFAAKRREAFPILWQTAEPLHTDKVLEYNIDQAIDESGAVKENASRELQSVRRSISEKYEQLRKKLESILRNVSDMGFSQDEIITTREGRMVIPVKSEHKNRVHGFIHSASASGATVFIEPSETLELNNEIRSLQFQEQREIERILRALTEQVGSAKNALVANLRILAAVDGLHAKAKYSMEILGIEPDVSEQGPIVLLQARHPVLLMNHGFKATVPLDLELGKEFNTLVISGPNAGGKSVAMKCVGLLALMVQAGMHIPASDQSTMRVFRKCFVDIGDEQSIENDLSTFSSHLRHLKDYAGQADADSLVLIDEIGSGTDPGEGGAIAASILEWLTERGAYTIATTHHGFLKVFAYETEGVENGAMEFDQATLTPTYRFHSGVPGSSYALEMAQRLGFHDRLMRRSRELLGHQQAKLDTLISELEASTQQYRKEMEAMAAEKATLDAMVGKYEEKISSLSKEIKEQKRRAVEEAENIVQRANATIERSVREIRESKAAPEAVRNVRQEVSRLREELSLQRTEVAEPSEPEAQTTFVVGSHVRLQEGSDTGEIVAIAPDRKTAVVVFGNVKMRIPVADLRGARARSATRPVRTENSEKPSVPQTELDIRGLTGDEALPMVDKFIDDAVLAGLHRIDIIHGKGTGALRKKVTEFLAQHPRVQTQRLGEWNEGGTGATVVELTEE
jgi:DNA mismatch repair protein MutS2